VFQFVRRGMDGYAGAVEAELAARLPGHPTARPPSSPTDCPTAQLPARPARAHGAHRAQMGKDNQYKLKKHKT